MELKEYIIHILLAFEKTDIKEIEVDVGVDYNLEIYADSLNRIK